LVPQQVRAEAARRRSRQAAKYARKVRLVSKTGGSRHIGQGVFPVREQLASPHNAQMLQPLTHCASGYSSKGSSHVHGMDLRLGGEFSKRKRFVIPLGEQVYDAPDPRRRNTLLPCLLASSARAEFYEHFLQQ
jgi:hypothetical protein